MAQSPGYPPNMRSRPFHAPRVVAYVTAAIALILVGVWFGGHPSWLPSPLRSAFVDQGNGQLVNEALDVLSRDYYRPINRSQLVDKGLSAAITSLNDPYSHYFDPSDYHAFLNQSDPHLSGIGIEVLPEKQGLRVTEVFPNSPAAKAGLQRGDLIVSVAGVSLANRSSNFGSRLIKGRAGTKVKLRVKSGSHTGTVEITRANLVVPVASSDVVTYKGVKIGIVRLTSFTDGSSGELRLQVQHVLRAGAQALILDLRGNGGGLLDEAVKVASIFIPDGTIVSTDGRSQPRQVYVAKGNAIAPRIPMVVLVDRGTASASEIVTGALKDRGRAKVVGTHTYGKGVFQEIETLPNGGALDITVGEYFTPSGRNLGGGGVRQGAGIPPDVYAAGTPHGTHDAAQTVAEHTVAAEVR
jgi:carboxyl-terminal processing protease